MMKSFRLEPDIYVYNLLLRCIRDCGVGNLDDFQSLIGIDDKEKLTSGNQFPSHTLKQSDADRIEIYSTAEDLSESISSLQSANDKNMKSFPHKRYAIDFSNKFSKGDSNMINGDNVYTDTLNPSALQPVNADKRIPILSPKIDTSAIIAVSDLSNSDKRLGLFGGPEGILGLMKHDNVQPNVLTYSQLIMCCEQSVAVENRILAKMKKEKVKPDTDLINAVIRRRALRREYDAARVRSLSLHLYSFYISY